MLRAFDRAREASRLQLAPADLLGEVPDLETEEDALSALDQLHDWGLLTRLQDDRRVRTLAEYRRRRSVFQMTEIGWLAWRAVEELLGAQPGEAELQRLKLPLVLEHLRQLDGAVTDGDGERAALMLGQVHDTLASLSHHAARFSLATNELAAAWEVDPESFQRHKGLLLTHLDLFLSALLDHRSALAGAALAFDARRERLIALVAAHGGPLDGLEARRVRAERHWDGVLGWFVERPGRPAQAVALEERTSRAIRDLALLLRRVLDASGGGVSRATQLEALAGWLISLEEDDAHALAAASSGLVAARHLGAPLADPEAVAPGTSWWEAPAAPVDTTLRRRGRRSAAPPAAPIPDRRKEKALLRQRQERQREAARQSREAMVQQLQLEAPLGEAELDALLRLLTRALHSRLPRDVEAVAVVEGTRLRLRPAAHDTLVPTARGTLVLPGRTLEVQPAGSAP